jgi:hypothetical protein
VPLPKNPLAFLDIQAVLDAALEAKRDLIFKARNAHGEFTPGAAVNWVQRANRFRQVLRERDQSLRPDNEFGRSKYDELTITRRCTCRASHCQTDPCVGHIIDIRFGTPARGDLSLPDGTPVEPARNTTPALEIDPLLAAALRAKRDLGLDE